MLGFESGIERHSANYLEMDQPRQLLALFWHFGGILVA
jgi:hypothetical protein